MQWQAFAHFISFSKICSWWKAATIRLAKKIGLAGTGQILINVWARWLKQRSNYGSASVQSPCWIFSARLALLPLCQNTIAQDSPAYVKCVYGGIGSVFFAQPSGKKTDFCIDSLSLFIYLLIYFFSFFIQRFSAITNLRSGKTNLRIHRQQ